MGGVFETNTEDLRSYGQRMAGRADQAKALGFGKAFEAVVMPAGLGEALADAAAACEEALVPVHGDWGFVGAQSGKDAAEFEQHEEDYGADFHQIREHIDQISENIRRPGERA